MPVAPIPMHPAAHVLHYASTCFEGFKAYRWADGSIHVFRMDRHIERLRQSAKLLMLPVPDEAQLERMILQTIDRNRAQVPEPPGRAVHAAGAVRHDAEHRRRVAAVERSDADRAREPGVGLLRGRHEAAAHLRRGPEAPHRGAPRHGQDRRQLRRGHGPDARGASDKYKIDQVLFCPEGSVQETGAANFLLIREGHILTRSLDSTFLHGVTRDSLLTMARQMGFKVEERVFDVAEMMEWVKTGEAALSGTAAVLAGVGTLVRSDGTERPRRHAATSVR